MQGFDCEYILFKKSVNMFELMEISESIYEGVVETSYKKPTREASNRASHSRENRPEYDLSQTHSVTSERACKCRKRYVYFPLV